MRLIDADALEKAFKDTVCIEPMPYAFVKQIIDNAPTVEDRTREVLSLQETIRKLTQERPHGKWIEKIYTEKLGHGYLTHHEIVCSVCGGSGENDENIPQCWKFCPNCGADMRGEEDANT